MAAVMGDIPSRYAPVVDDDQFEDIADEEQESSDEEPEKGATEEELERLIFGDKAGFREEVGGFRQRAQLEDAADFDIEIEEEEDNNLATVNSADLFFLDAGPSNLPEGALLPANGNDEEELALKWDPPAWQDSDDERMMVSLMSVPRLRKLRQFDGEDVINGREYVKRLRRQFELLHPRPEWASWSGLQKNSRKRRRTFTGSSISSSSSEVETDASDLEGASDNDFSVAPLAKLLRTSAPLTLTAQTLPNKRLKLSPNTISIERMKDISPTQPSAITSLTIHPHLPLLLSSGLSSTLFLHHIYPHPTPPDAPNPLITSLHLKHTPLTTTAFAPPSPGHEGGPQILLSSRRRYFHTWDLPTGEVKKITRVYGQAATQRSMEVLKPSPCGRYLALLGSTKKGGAGLVNVLSASTYQWHSQCVVESRKGLADFAWWGDGRGLCIVGKGGEVAEYDVEEKRIVARWHDEGAVGTTTLVLGGRNADQRKKNAAPPLLGPDRWVAVGSTSGIVNIYERGAWSWAKDANSGGLQTVQMPTPTKTLANLTTPISHLTLSPCGQLLAMSSRWKRDALRLVHLPSCTVYRNWPTSKTPLGRISAVALGEYSREDGAGRVMVLAVGNEAGALRAWEITG